ncbi:MAG: YjgP/YjgQ family permease, partial [Nitrospirae bacterium]
AYEVSIFHFDKLFHLIDRVEAKEAVWTGNNWELRDIKIFGVKDDKFMTKKSLPFTLLEAPEALVKEVKGPEEMNFFELYSYYKRIRETGYRNVKYEVDLYGKLTLPFINFVMVLFGVAISLVNPTASGLRSMGIGVVIVILYWLINSGCMSLGYAEQLPPWLAPLITPFIFVIGGLYLFFKIKE